MTEFQEIDIPQHKDVVKRINERFKLNARIVKFTAVINPKEIMQQKY